MTVSLEIVQAFIGTWGGKITGATTEWVMMECPFAGVFHSKGTDGTPSFGIRIGGNGEFNCFSCETRGRSLHNLGMRLVSEIGTDGWEFEKALKLGADLIQGAHTPEVLQELQEKKAKVVKIIDPKDEDSVFAGCVSPTEHTVACNYLHSRSISAEGAADLGVLFDPEWMRLVFPIRNMYGQLIGVQVHPVAPKEGDQKYLFLSVFGVLNSDMMWGMDRAANCTEMPQTAPTLCVEGVMDLMSVRFVYPKCLAFLGTMSKAKLAMLHWYRPLTVLADNDTAGIAKAKLIQAEFPETQIYTCPAEFPDPNEFDQNMPFSFVQSLQKLYAAAVNTV